jgi:hypothetical protein
MCEARSEHLQLYGCREAHKHAFNANASCGFGEVSHTAYSRTVRYIRSVLSFEGLRTERGYRGLCIRRGAGPGGGGPRQFPSRHTHSLGSGERGDPHLFVELVPNSLNFTTYEPNSHVSRPRVYVSRDTTRSGSVRSVRCSLHVTKEHIAGFLVALSQFLPFAVCTQSSSRILSQRLSGCLRSCSFARFTPQRPLEV